MHTDIKILKLLLDDKQNKYTIKKISERLSINYRIAYDRIAMLEKEGLLRITRIGNSKICEFAYKFNSKVYEAEFERRIDLFKNKDFLVLRSKLTELNFTFIVLLFGSYAKGTNNKNSDIDLLTIDGDYEEIQKAISLWPEKIHLTAISYQNFINMAKSKEFSVVSEAIKNNIILIGIEEYYRLIKNAGLE